MTCNCIAILLQLIFVDNQQTKTKDRADRGREGQKAGTPTFTGRAVRKLGDTMFVIDDLQA